MAWRRASRAGTPCGTEFSFSRTGQHIGPGGSPSPWAVTGSGVVRLVRVVRPSLGRDRRWNGPWRTGQRVRQCCTRLREVRRSGALADAGRVWAAPDSRPSPWQPSSVFNGCQNRCALHQIGGEAGCGKPERGDRKNSDHDSRSHRENMRSPGANRAPATTRDRHVGHSLSAAAAAELRAKTSAPTPQVTTTRLVGCGESPVGTK